LVGQLTFISTQFWNFPTSGSGVISGLKKLDFFEISQISPQSQKLKFPKLVQIIAQGYRNCRITQKDFSENLHYRKTYKKEI
jgi:hypothetical protein